MKKAKKRNKKKRERPALPKLTLGEQRIRDQFTDVVLAIKGIAGTQDIREPTLRLADAINNVATEMRNLREKSHTLEKLADLLHIANVGVK